MGASRNHTATVAPTPGSTSGVTSRAPALARTIARAVTPPPTSTDTPRPGVVKHGGSSPGASRNGPSPTTRPANAGASPVTGGHGAVASMHAPT